MSTIKRDPETGQVATINGGFGKLLAWMKVFQPLVLFVMGTVLVPLAVVHYQEHEHFRIFMSAGPRATPETVEKAVTGLRSELIERGALPGAERRLETLERDMVQVKATQIELKALVVANGTNIQAILRILRQD